MQRGADGVNGQRHAREHAEAQREEPRQHGKLHVQEAADSLNGGQIHARGEQNGRAQDARQHHRRDGDRAGEEDIKQRERRERREADASQRGRAAQQREPYDHRHAEQGERRAAELFQRRALRRGDERDKGDRPAGDAGDAVRQRHAEAVECR